MTGIFYDTEELDMILQENEDGTMTFDRAWMIEQLRQRDCRVIFTKANGEERDMVCTLREDVIPASSSDNNTEPKTKGYSDSAIRVIDVNKGEWRSFRVDSVVSFS